MAFIPKMLIIVLALSLCIQEVGPSYSHILPDLTRATLEGECHLEVKISRLNLANGAGSSSSNGKEFRKNSNVAIVDISSTKSSSESKLSVTGEGKYLWKIQCKAENTLGTENGEIISDPDGWEVWHIVVTVAITWFFAAVIILAFHYIPNFIENR